MAIEEYQSWCMFCQATTVHRLTTVIDPENKEVVVEQKKCMKCLKFETRKVRAS